MSIERERGEGGSATVEFLALGVLLLVPLIYVTITMSRIQAAAFAADSSARAAARAYVTADNDSSGRWRAAIAVQLGLEDQGFADPDDGDLLLECSAPPDCLIPGGRVTAHVEVRVNLPWLPGFVDRSGSTELTVRASQVQMVDEFRVIGSAQ